MKAALIIGNHPIRQSLTDQLEAKGYRIDTFQDFEAVHDVNGYRELCILPDYDIADENTLQALEEFAKRFPMPNASASKPICHLLLHSRITLWLLQTLDLYQEIHRKFELYAFTLDDQWAKNVFCQPDSQKSTYPHLDRERIDSQSNKTVHLVIDGLSDIGESLAFHAALTAHFPNFTRDHTLRTRITILDENIMERKNSFIQRYQYLFDHSYHRTIDLQEQKMTQFHEPMYRSSREDFVDIEWEFVKGTIYNPYVQQKLTSWSNDRNQILTIALCNPQWQHNFDQAFVMPKAVYLNEIPVLVYLKHATFLDKVKETEEFDNIFPFGMEDCGYDIDLPLLQMAKRLNYFYACSYGLRGVPTHLPAEEIEEEWNKLDSFRARYSNIYNVMTLATKMRSLGHPDDDWTRFYALTQEEIEEISAVEHNRWCVERLLLGFRPPTDEERDEIHENIQAFLAAKKTGSPAPEQDLKNVYKRKKIHYDLCSYRELQEDKTGQNVRVYDYDLTACIPLIAQSYNESRS